MKVYVFYLLPPHLLLKGHIFQTYDSTIKFPLPYINCIKIFNRHVKPASEILCTLTTCPSYCDHKIMNISDCYQMGNRKFLKMTLVRTWSKIFFKLYVDRICCVYNCCIYDWSKTIYGCL